MGFRETLARRRPSCWRNDDPERETALQRHHLQAWRLPLKLGFHSKSECKLAHSKSKRTGSQDVRWYMVRLGDRHHQARIRVLEILGGGMGVVYNLVDIGTFGRPNSSFVLPSPGAGS